jgi:hypothetical protein
VLAKHPMVYLAGARNKTPRWILRNLGHPQKSGAYGHDMGTRFTYDHSDTMAWLLGILSCKQVGLRNLQL